MSLIQKKVISAIVCDGMVSMIPDVHPKFFSDRALKNVYKAIFESLSAKKACDYETVMDVIANNGFKEMERDLAMAALKNVVKEKHDIGPGLADELQAEYRQGLFKKTSDFISDAANTDTQKIETVEKAFRDLTDFQSGGDGESLQVLINQYRDSINSGEQQEIASRAIKFYSEKIAALFPTGRLYPLPYYIAAREHFGKTLVLMNIIAELIHCGKTGIFYSLENKDDVIRNKYIALKTNITYENISMGELNEHQKKIINENLLTGAERLIIKDKTISVDEFIRDARKECQIKKIDYIAIDHIHAFWGLGKNISDQAVMLSHLSGGIREICKEFRIPVIALAQVRENDSIDKAKTQVALSIGDIKGSGSIKENARFVFLIDGLFEGQEKNWKVAKAEIGKRFMKQIVYDGATGRLDRVYNA